MILKDWLLWASKTCSENLQENRGQLSYQELLYLVKAVFGFEIVSLDFELKEVALRCLDIALERRLTGESLAKIVNLKPFSAFHFISNQFTLDPRPETEFLLDKISFKPRSILELGVGTGCLLLSALKIFPKAKGVGVDISPQALEVAIENAFILGLASKSSFFINDWACGLSGYFDLILANPPYVERGSKNELSFETLSDPHLALFGSFDTYLALVDSLVQITFKQVLLEVPKYLLDKVAELLKERYVSAQIESFPIYDSEIFCISLMN